MEIQSSRGERRVPLLLIVMLILVAASVAATFTLTRPKRREVMKPNQVAILFNFTAINNGNEILFTYGLPQRDGKLARATKLVPRRYALVDRSLPSDRIVYVPGSCEGLNLGVVAYNPITVRGTSTAAVVLQDRGQGYTYANVSTPPAPKKR